MLSKKTKYAFKALIYLAQQADNEPKLISDISGHTRAPQKFLEAILLELKKMGILNSKKGKGGGYYIRVEPKQVKLSTIIRKINGPIALLPCASINYYESCDECLDEETCTIKKTIEEVRDETLRILENKTLADMI